MKKNYVNLELQVVDVQLSDCIAGSVPSIVYLKSGVSVNNEVDTAHGSSSVSFKTW